MTLRVIPNSRGIKPVDIAPCGMNCRLCYATMRKKNQCPGCRSDDQDKRISCSNCRIKNCGSLQEKNLKYCFSCAVFPCQRLKQLDKRYRTKYGMSMIENLNYIKEHGVRTFIKKETVRWTCPSCGILLCVHRPDCAQCGYSWR